MGRGLKAGESPATRAIFALTAVTLLFALLLGGGQGSVGESLLSLFGLALILAASGRMLTSPVYEHRGRWFWWLPAGLLLLPLLHALPLPHAIWAHLPGRAPIAADLAAAGVPPAALAWSLTPLNAERMLWFCLVPVGVFMGAAVLHGRQRRQLVIGVLVFAAISSVMGLWQRLEGVDSRLYLYEITNRGDAVGLFANRNHLAGFLAAVLPVAVGTLADRLRHRVDAARDLWVWLLTASIVLLSVTITATRSRAGFVLLMASVVASAAVWVRSSRNGQGEASRSWLRVGGLLATVLIAQFTLLGILQRLDSDPLDDHRWTMTANTLQVARAAAGTGLGLGSFVHAYDEIGDRAADMPQYVNHAHNDYAELWLEGGLPALALACVALVMIGVQLRKYLQPKTPDSGPMTHHRGLKLGAAFSLLLLAVHSFVDYPLRTLTIATYVALLAAVLQGSVRISRRPLDN